jgi:hypothetical protein
MQIQILRRKCDNPRCDTGLDLPVGNLTPMLELDLGNWIILTKEHVLQTGQQPQPMTKMGCCSSCAIEIIKNSLLDMPKVPLKIPAAN